jgi:hypothetical protein
MKVALRARQVALQIPRMFCASRNVTTPRKRRPGRGQCRRVEMTIKGFNRQRVLAGLAPGQLQE